MAFHETVVVEIRDEDSLLMAREHVLDGLMPLGSLMHDERGAWCEMIVLLPDKMRSEYERMGLFFWRRITPFRKWKLVFHAVRSIQYEFHMGAMLSGDFSIGDISYDAKKGVSIFTHEGLVLHLAVNHLEGKLICTPEFDHEHSLTKVVVSLFPPAVQRSRWGSVKGGG